MKKQPMRMCVVCRQMTPKRELVRVYKTESGEIAVDQTGRAGGRGAYVCKGDCIDQLLKRKAFDRALGGKTTTELLDDIKRLTDEQ